MEVMTTKSIRVNTEKEGVISTFPGWEGSVSDVVGKDLLRMGAVIDTIENKAAAKQFLSMLANQTQKPTTVKAAKDEFKKTI